MAQLTIEIYREEVASFEEAKQKAIEIARPTEGVGEPDDWKEVNKPDRDGWEFVWNLPL